MGIETCNDRGMAEFGLPLQGKIEFGDRKPWALPTAKVALRFQRVEAWLRDVPIRGQRPQAF